MNYKIGDIVECEIEIRSSGRKAVLSRYLEEDQKLEIGQFQIIGKNGSIYTILIPDDFIGWNINRFHILHCGIDSEYLNKRFWDISEEFILKKAK